MANPRRDHAEIMKARLDKIRADPERALFSGYKGRSPSGTVTVRSTARPPRPGGPSRTTTATSAAVSWSDPRNGARRPTPPQSAGERGRSAAVAQPRPPAHEPRRPARVRPGPAPRRRHLPPARPPPRGSGVLAATGRSPCPPRQPPRRAPPAAPLAAPVAGVRHRAPDRGRGDRPARARLTARPLRAGRPVAVVAARGDRRGLRVGGVGQRLRGGLGRLCRVVGRAGGVLVGRGRVAGRGRLRQ
jgi:hypothetical protein